MKVFVAYLWVLEGEYGGRGGLAFLVYRAILERKREKIDLEKKPRENGRDREFLGFFFINFQEEEGYLYKKLGEERDSRGCCKGGVRLPLGVLPPHPI